MRPRLTRLHLPAFALVAALCACGEKIGDSCAISSDCAQDGTRICDITSPDGYCTIQGCDASDCPGESVCMRFFPVSLLTEACTVDDDCALDEICTLAQKCAPLATEARFCVLKCGGHGDCRQNYECRDEERMRAFGGEPLRRDDGTLGDIVPFCAPAQHCYADEDCQFDNTCDLAQTYCVAGS